MFTLSSEDGPNAIRELWHLESKSRYKLAAAMLWFGSAAIASLVLVWSAPAFLLQGMLLLFLLSPFIADLIRGSFDIFELRNMFCLGYFLQFVVSTWYSQNIEYRYVSESFFNVYLSRSLTLALVGLLSYYAGYYMPLASMAVSHLRPLATCWRTADLPKIVAVFVIVAFSSWIFLMRQIGGLYFVLTHLYNITELVEGMTFLFSITVGAFYAAVVLCELQGQRSGSRNYKLTAGCLAVVNLAVLLTRGYKFPFAIVALVFWVPRHYLANGIRRSAKLWKILISIGVLTLVPYYQMFRGGGSTKLGIDSLLALDVNWTNALPLILRRYYGIEVFGLILSKVGNGVPHAMGSSLLLFFTGSVPRALWPGKPLGPGLYVTDLFFDNPFAVMTGTEPSIPGELYWNFGVVGVVVGMALLGALCRAVYVFLKRNQNRSGVLLYLPWVFWAFECNDGNLADSVYSFVVVYTAPLVLAYLLLAPTAKQLRNPSLVATSS